MIRWICVILVVLIVAISVVECAWHLTPLEQLTAVMGKGDGAFAGNSGKTTIRIAIASWQMEEFPWETTIKKYEQAHPDIHIQASVIPDGAMNSQLLFWASGYTDFDVEVAWADDEFRPLVDYNWKSPDPARRSLLINVRDYLTAQQLDSFVPAFFVGSTRKDPTTGKDNLYELPWLGEVMSLNYNKEFFRQRGITRPPETWDEVEQACEKIKGLEYNSVKVAPLSMNFSDAFGQSCYLPLLAAFKAGKGVTDEDGHVDVSSPEAVEVFSRLKQWYRKGYISDDCMIPTSVEQDLRVMRSAMYPSWQSRGLWAVKDHGPNVIGIAPTPDAKTGGTLACTYGCLIPKCSPHIKEAVSFAYEAFCTDTYGFQSAVINGWRDETTGKVAAGGKMPVLKKMYEPGANLPPGILELGQSLNRSYSFPDPVNWKQCSDILMVEFQKFLNSDSITAEQALAAVRQRLAEEVYKEN